MTIEWTNEAIREARWALCENAGGAGEGKCGDDCCCVSEAKIAVEAAFATISANGYAIVPVEALRAAREALNNGGFISDKNRVTIDTVLKQENENE